jgi:hypothetical protein
VSKLNESINKERKIITCRARLFGSKCGLFMQISSSVAASARIVNTATNLQQLHWKRGRLVMEERRGGYGGEKRRRLENKERGRER